VKSRLNDIRAASLDSATTRKKRMADER